MEIDFNNNNKWTFEFLIYKSSRVYMFKLNRAVYMWSLDIKWTFRPTLILFVYFGQVKSAHAGN